MKISGLSFKPCFLRYSCEKNGLKVSWNIFLKYLLYEAKNSQHLVYVLKLCNIKYLC